MKLRPLPIVISLVLSVAVLFGGWFTYRSMAMENPLLELVHASDGVEQVQLDVKKNQVSFQLELSKDASLRQIIQHIRNDGAKTIGTRSLNIQVTNPSSPALDAWWSDQLFTVAQAMETRNYAKIPQTLSERASQLDGLNVFTEMDDRNVYVRLVAGDDSKYIILPRTPEKLGVWANE
jgi:hypothetical protein